jgi:hypothetical protein
MWSSIWHSKKYRVKTLFRTLSISEDLFLTQYTHSNSHKNVRAGKKEKSYVGLNVGSS